MEIKIKQKSTPKNCQQTKNIVRFSVKLNKIYW